MKIMNLSLRGITPATAPIVEGQRGEYYAVQHGEQGRGRWQVSLPLAVREFPVPMAAPIGGMQFTSPLSELRTVRGFVPAKCTECGHEGSIHLSSALDDGWIDRPFTVEVVQPPCRECLSAEARRKAPLPLGGIDFRLHDLGRKDAHGNQQYLLVQGRQDGQTLVLWSLDPGFRGSASYKVEGRAALVAEGWEAQGDAGRAGGCVCPIVLVAGPCRLTWTRSGRLYGSASRWVADYDGETWTVACVDVCAAEEAAQAY